MSMPESGREQEIQNEMAREAKNEFVGNLMSRHPILQKDLAGIPREDVDSEIDFGGFYGKHTGENISRSLKLRFTKGEHTFFQPLGTINSQWQRPEWRKASGYEGNSVVESYEAAGQKNPENWKALEA